VNFLSAQEYNKAENYNVEMRTSLQKLRNAKSLQNYQNAAQEMEQIAKKNKSKWIPYYHAAHAYIQAAFLTRDKTLIETFLNKAQPLIDQAKKLRPYDSEIITLQGLLYEAKTMIDPAKLSDEYLRKAVKEYDHARFIDKENPRPYYLIGRILYQLPGEYSNKESACKHFRNAADRFKTFKPKSEYSPNWGEVPNHNMLQKCQ